MSLDNISITAAGSRGDIQPYIAIGSALRNSGYNVRVLTNVNHASFVQSFDLQNVSVFPDTEHMLKTDPTVMKAMANGDSAMFFQFIKERSEKVAIHQCKAFLEEMQENPPDLLINGAGGYYGYYASLVLKIPTLKLSLQAIIKDSTRAPWGLPTLPEGKHCEVLDSLFGGVYDAMKHRDEIMKSLPGGSMLLPRLPKSKFLQNWEAPELPCLVCQSPLFKQILYPRSHPNYHFVGASIIDSSQQKAHSENFGGRKSHDLIEDFLQDDPERKPVYCGWGSMICKSAEYMVEFAVRALMISEQRGIVLGGWAGLSMDILRETTSDNDLIEYAEKNVLFVEQASHENLFPRVACTVHHGGAGTTNAAFRAGVPTIITPVFLDQYDHSYLVTKLGVGIGFTKQLQKMTAEDLGAAIKEVISSNEMMTCAQELGEELRKEDGAAAVVSHVQNFWDSYVKSGRLRNIIDANLEAATHAK